jgi:hypothetical protein
MEEVLESFAFMETERTFEKSWACPTQVTGEEEVGSNIVQPNKHENKGGGDRLGERERDKERETEREKEKIGRGRGRERETEREIERSP